MSFILTLFLSFSLINSDVRADAPIPLKAARTKKSVLAFPEIRVTNSSHKSLTKTISETVTTDLSFMNLFRFLPSQGFVEDATQAGLEPGTFKYADWSQIGVEFLIKAALVREDSKHIILETHLYDVVAGKQLLAKKYFSDQAGIKTIAHLFAQDVVQTLTGQPGIFLTKIAMTCDVSGKKEIYLMNFDGTDVKQVTHHRSLAFAPAWSPDGTKLAYSVYTRHKNNVRNIDLYEFNFINNSIRLISNRKGMNSGAAYSPDGNKIAATLSFSGSPSLYLIDTQSLAITRITHSLGFDVDPAWSPDGKKLAFVSSRSGTPMVFSTNVDGTDIQRITFAGRYNATPSWSPQDNKIAFAGWIDQSFDIFIMNPDGTQIERLTKNQGNNEDPFFSPDGNFLTFSSNRTGQKNIYITNLDGTVVKRLTYGLGNCVAPKWSNPPPPPVTHEK